MKAIKKVDGMECDFVRSSKTIINPTTSDIRNREIITAHLSLQLNHYFSNIMFFDPKFFSIEN